MIYDVISHFSETCSNTTDDAVKANGTHETDDSPDQQSDTNVRTK